MKTLTLNLTDAQYECFTNEGKDKGWTLEQWMLFTLEDASCWYANTFDEELFTEDELAEMFEEYDGLLDKLADEDLAELHTLRKDCDSENFSVQGS